MVGTCRHFAVTAAAFLKAAGIPARARCGFATCFVAGKGVDHWITEWWTTAAGGDGRWVRTDPEWLGTSPGGARTEDLRPGEFLTAGEAWQRVRQGADEGADYGVVGTENWGPGEIRGNAMRDLAALEGVEVLPWDEWGPMHDSYQGRTGDDFDRLVDELAVACERDDDGASAERHRLLAALGPMDFE